MEDLNPNAMVALMLAQVCVRNTFLEDLHAGTFPSSMTGDYSDVKVVSQYGEIPWNKLSRFNDEEMKQLMKEVVNKLYSFLELQGNENFMKANAMFYPHHWDLPGLDAEFVLASNTYWN